MQTPIEFVIEHNSTTKSKKKKKKQIAVSSFTCDD